MNKSELVQSISDRSMLSKKDSEGVLNVVLNCIRAAVEKGESVRLAGFGTFDVVMTAPRTGRNPNTGERIEIPAGFKVRFTPSDAFKKAVNR